MIYIAFSSHNATDGLKEQIIGEYGTSISPKISSHRRMSIHIFLRKIDKNGGAYHSPSKVPISMETNHIFPMISKVYHGLEIHIIFRIPINILQYFVRIFDTGIIIIHFFRMSLYMNTLKMRRYAIPVTVVTTFQMNNNKLRPLFRKLFQTVHDFHIIPARMGGSHSLFRGTGN